MSQTFAAIADRLNGDDVDAGWWNMLKQAGMALETSVAAIQPTDFVIANNQSSPANVTGLLFSGAVYRSFEIDYNVYRNTTSAGATELAERGKLIGVFKTAAGTWEMPPGSLSVGDAGITFSITSAGQVQYTSTNITGTAATSKMTFTARALGV